MLNYSRSIYSAARIAAGITQESAAEVLHLGVRTLADYETGARRPSAQTVSAMAQAYGAPELRLEHAMETDELGIFPERKAPERFELLVLQFYTGLMSFAQQHRGEQLLQIAADGVISNEERPLLDEIIRELDGITAVLLALRTK